MSEIKLNIITANGAINGEVHGSFGEALAASLCAEPETIEELETALQRFIECESDWSPFRWFKKHADFEPYDAGIVVIDLAARVLVVDSTYSSFSKEGTIRIADDDGEDFDLPYRLPDDWQIVRSIPEYEGLARVRREERLKNPLFDSREILFGKPLCSFIAAEYLANKDAADEDLFTNIHAKWLMTARDDLQGKTPREILLEKQDFIGWDLHSRSLQWTVTKQCPPPISLDSRAFRFAGFGTHEIVVYYDLFRFLLGECFERQITKVEVLERLTSDWLNNPQPEFSGRTPANIIESERRRKNLTMSAHECLIDEDCELCQMMAAEFDTPMFWHLDGSQMEYDRFEFSFDKTREEWEAEQRRYEEFNREFAEGKWQNDDETDDFFDSNQEIK